jgi:hypothetical protein
MFLITIRLLTKKYNYIIKLPTIVMNLSMCVNTTSHYIHLDYLFKILPMYVVNICIVKY